MTLICNIVFVIFFILVFYAVRKCCSPLKKRHIIVWPLPTNVHVIFSPNIVALDPSQLPNVQQFNQLPLPNVQQFNRLPSVRGSTFLDSNSSVEHLSRFDPPPSYSKYGSGNMLTV